ncbi:hypothetical protein Cfor_09737, partial [Coptotermes formosanus]
DYASNSQRPVAKHVDLHWDSPEVESWKKEAKEVQHNFYEMLGGDRMKPGVYSKLNKKDFERKIAYAMFGPPPQLPNPQLNAGTGYKHKQLKAVRKTRKAIFKQTEKEEVSVSFLFVCLKTRKEHVVSTLFRIVAETEHYVEEPGEKYIYVDGNQRVYKGWLDYLKHNKLPRCFMCYPHNGIYTTTDSKVNVDFGESPACKSPEKVLSVVDITTSLVAAALGITTIAVPVSAPLVITATVLGLASGIISFGRSATTLVDRYSHGQTLGLNSSEARSNWIGVLGSSVGMALGGISMVASRIVHGTRVAGLNAGVASLSIGSTTLKGLTILNHFADVGKKLVDEEEVTSLDAFQMAASVFFFTGSVVSTRSAFGALLHLKSTGVEMRMADILKVVQSRSALSAEVIGAATTSIDGEVTIEEPEMLWPDDEDHYWKCTIL